MTFQTNTKNEFKKDPLRGLEYNKTNRKPAPFVQIALTMLACLIIATVFKICTDKPDPIPTTVLNADRR